jgi:hypothetical protein
MENKKPLSPDQLNKLKEAIRQRFDELYHRIGSNRQNLFNKVLFVDQQLNKELTKEQIDEAHEKEILRKVREVERSADSQLPHIHKVAPASVAAAPVAATKVEKPVKESKPNEPKAKESKPKPAKSAKAKPAAKKKK